MAQREVTNLEVYLNTRYNTAHDLLETDPEAAERMFASLLQNPHLPLWKRAQCNGILACISGDPEEALLYLRDARHVLGLFEDRLARVTEVWTVKIVAMKEHFNELEQELEQRRDIATEQAVTEAATSDESTVLCSQQSAISKRSLASPQSINKLPSNKATTSQQLRTPSPHGTNNHSGDAHTSAVLSVPGSSPMLRAHKPAQ
ncbi:hypothetical protein LTR56_021367 [Elasticomyces elasticus]|nr:hypothetical protein LTR22_026147 [Elasticomyces elasticus]KAK3623813.1 hypothetical protein LTR56_021367 [Elasticomyces elasticus]KAK4921019.1 hypothetical protein LTR49_011563 [Elasticomyces elasticus]KAK5759476.1 hypothetical protein LTS12_010334 [Elasticomyces elasticus]